MKITDSERQSFEVLNSFFEAALGELGTVKRKTTLYHYTSISNLSNILKSKELWFSDARFTNDPGEVSYVLQNLEKCINSVNLQLGENPHVRRFLGAIASSLRIYFSDSVRCFIMSFSQSNDSLSQWIQYGDRGCGCCLEFTLKPTYLAPMTNNQRSSFLWTDNFIAIRVNYSQTKMTRVLESLLQKSCQIFLQNGSQNLEYIGRLGTRLASYIVTLVPCFKHKAYKEEREIRLIKIGDSSKFENIMYRNSGNLLLPYVPHVFYIGDPGEISATGILFGPACSPEARIGTSDFVRSSFPKSLRITNSAIPYRQK